MATIFSTADRATTRWTAEPGTTFICLAAATGEIASRNITVNAVAPGFIETDMTRALDEAQVQALRGQIPLARLGTSADIAAAVAFLASDLAGYITGETLNVNGGLSMH